MRKLLLVLAVSALGFSLVNASQLENIRISQFDNITVADVPDIEVPAVPEKAHALIDIPGIGGGSDPQSPLPGNIFNDFFWYYEANMPYFANNTLSARFYLYFDAKENMDKWHGLLKASKIKVEKAKIDYLTDDNWSVFHIRLKDKDMVILRQDGGIYTDRSLLMHEAYVALINLMGDGKRAVGLVCIIKDNGTYSFAIYYGSK